MRNTDPPEQHRALGAPIRPAPVREAERWEPMTNAPGYERNQAGAVRKVEPPSIYELYGVPIFLTNRKAT